MLVFILALLIVWPIAEIYVMILVSQAVGFFWMLSWFSSRRCRDAGLRHADGFTGRGCAEP